MSIDITQVARDADGYLINPEDWDEALAARLAEEEGIALDVAYWPVLHFVRAYWGEHRVTPDVRHVVDFLAQTQNISKRDAKRQLFRLFPYGYVQQTCKIAGMQRPRAWSTG